MSITPRLFLCLFTLSSLAQENVLASADSSNIPFFLFDQADEITPSVRLENPLFYDAAIVPNPQGLWVAWLEYQPGQGDQLWIGQRSHANWLSKKQLSAQPGDYAN